MADVLKVDPNDLTIGDLEDFEKMAGRSFTSATRADKSGNVELTASDLIALVTIVKRKDNPDFTQEDARNIKLSELKIGEDKPDPSDAAG